MHQEKIYGPGDKARGVGSVDLVLMLDGPLKWGVTMTQSEQTAANQAAAEIIDCATFFETAPPLKPYEVAKFWVDVGAGIHNFKFPPIQMYCSNDNCKKKSVFRSDTFNQSNKESLLFVNYTCSNCQTRNIVFSISISARPTRATMFKFGEVPFMDEPTPNRLLNVAGSDKDLFKKGRLCEFLGLGIAASVYYRRVVENQKGLLINELIKVCKSTNQPAQMIETLEAARNEKRFSAAVEAIKDAIPPTLMIKGYNPLTLLHGILSKHVHELTDEECLKDARDMRAILVSMMDKVNIALNDEAEVVAAAQRLMQPKTSTD